MTKWMERVAEKSFTSPKTTAPAPETSPVNPPLEEEAEAAASPIPVDVPQGGVDPRLFRAGRDGAPQSAAGAEVGRARDDPSAKSSRDDRLLLQHIDAGITIRQVTETATFPDGRSFSVTFNEYSLKIVQNTK